MDGEREDAGELTKRCMKLGISWEGPGGDDAFVEGVTTLDWRLLKGFWKGDCSIGEAVGGGLICGEAVRAG